MTDDAWRPIDPVASTRWYRVASHVLVAIAAFLLVHAYFSSPDAPDCEDPRSECSVFDVGEQRARDLQIQRVGGQALVIAVEFKAWATSWLHGRKLEVLLAAVALLSAWVSRRWGESVAQELLDGTPGAGRPRASANDEPLDRG